MADSTIQTGINTNAAGPLRATGESGSFEQHSLPDQIAADKYLAGKAANKVGLGIRLVKLVPGSPSGIDLSSRL